MPLTIAQHLRLATVHLDRPRYLWTAARWDPMWAAWNLRAAELHLDAAEELAGDDFDALMALTEVAEAYDAVMAAAPEGGTDAAGRTKAEADYVRKGGLTAKL